MQFRNGLRCKINDLAGGNIVRDEGVAGSNPAAPTNFLTMQMTFGERYGARNPAAFQCAAAISARYHFIVERKHLPAGLPAGSPIRPTTWPKNQKPTATAIAAAAAAAYGNQSRSLIMRQL
jgi:hypothetical protein